MKTFIIISATLICCVAMAEKPNSTMNSAVSEQDISKQRELLTKNTDGAGFGPQSPRDIDSPVGTNPRIFAAAPNYSMMNLCNIHFHKNAEHKGGEFNQYAGNGDGHGYQSGYLYSGHLKPQELKPTNVPICPSKHGSLVPGDTIEVHYVHSTANVKPGPTLYSCFNDAIKNPQLRVESQVLVLVNEQSAVNFNKLTQLGVENGLNQALNIPNNTGTPVQYSGSTTGPDYNVQGSPFQVSWAVRPKVTKVNIETIGEWCKDNVFDEDHAHGVRNLVINPLLLAKIK